MNDVKLKRIAVFQPLVPDYRAPFFEKIGSNNQIDLTIFCGCKMGSLSGNKSSIYYKQINSPTIYKNLFNIELKIQIDHLKVDLNEYDIVIASWDSRYLTLGILILRCKLSNTPIVLWGHGYSKYGSGFRDVLRNFLGKRADSVLLYSKSTAKRLIKHSSFDQNKVFVAQNAIDHLDIQKAIKYWSGNSELAAFREKNDLDVNCTVIFVSRLEVDNCIDLMFPVLENIKKTMTTCKLVLVGDGDDRVRLQSIVEEMLLSGSVIFTGAIYDEKELAPWMLSASFFCYPKNIGLSVHHAFCYGLPVITSDHISSHNPEIELVINGESGLLYKEGDLENLSGCWRQMFTDKSARDLMSKNAKKLVYDEYTIDNMCLGFLNALSAVDDS